MLSSPARPRVVVVLPTEFVLADATQTPLATEQMGGRALKMLGCSKKGDENAMKMEERGHGPWGLMRNNLIMPSEETS